MRVPLLLLLAVLRMGAIDLQAEQEDLYHRTGQFRPPAPPARPSPDAPVPDWGINNAFLKKWEWMGRPVIGHRIYIPVAWALDADSRGRPRHSLGRVPVRDLFASLKPQYRYFTVVNQDLGFQASLQLAPP